MEGTVAAFSSLKYSCDHERGLNLTEVIKENHSEKVGKDGLSSLAI